MFGDHLPALFTLHGAAPVEPAVAAGDKFCPFRLRFKATLSAEPPAAPLLPLGQVLPALQALPPLRALQAQADVSGAVVRRVLQEDQFPHKQRAEGPRTFCAVPSSHPPLVHIHLLSLVIFHLQVISNLSKACKLKPASLEAAAPR